MDQREHPNRAIPSSNLDPSGTPSVHPDVRGHGLDIHPKSRVHRPEHVPRVPRVPDVQRPGRLLEGQAPTGDLHHPVAPGLPGGLQVRVRALGEEGGAAAHRHGCRHLQKYGDALWAGVV